MACQNPHGQVLDGILWTERAYLCVSCLPIAWHEMGLSFTLRHYHDTKSLLTFSFPWARIWENGVLPRKSLDNLGRQEN